MKNPPDAFEIKKDVLQAHEHVQLSSEEIAKAVARHKREHPAAKQTASKPQKKHGK